MRLFWPGFHAYLLWWLVAIAGGAWPFDDALARFEAERRELWRRGQMLRWQA